jgi:hypothetical protein
MSASLSKILGRFVALVAAVSVAAVASAQGTPTKETVPGGKPIVRTQEVKGELVAMGSNWLIAKHVAGDYKLYNVQAGQQFTIDGVPRTLNQLQLGTMLTGRVTVTETPLINRTTTVTEGTVFWASPTSIIVTLQNRENKQYEVPRDFTFNVEGKSLTAMELKPGMKLTATKIIEEPHKEISRDVVVTGTMKK